MPDGPSCIFISSTINPSSIILIVVLLLFGAVFSISETSLAMCNRIRMKVKADDGNKAAKIVCKIVDKMDQAVSALLIGNNIVAVIISSIATILFVQNIMPNASESVAGLVATIVTTALCFLFSDTLPKTIAKIFPDRIALITGWFVYFLMIILFPITMIFKGINWLVCTIFHIKEDVQISEDDFTNIIESIEEEGIIEEQESDIIINSLDFNDTVVKDVLTPVDKIYALNIKDLTTEKLNKVILETSYSRIPIYQGDINHIIGVLVVNSYLHRYLANPKISIRSLLTKVYTVKPSINLDQLFEGFKKHKTHIAIVKSNGRTIGMVTMDDLLDELVSDDVPSDNGGEK